MWHEKHRYSIELDINAETIARDEIPDEYIDQGDKSETESSCPSSVLDHTGSLGAQVNASLRRRRAPDWLTSRPSRSNQQPLLIPTHFLHRLETQLPGSGSVPAFRVMH